MKFLEILFGFLLSFFSILTIGNTPYPIAGYGLSAFAIFFIAYSFSRKEALIGFILGNTLGSFFAYFTESIFLLVAIGAALVRPLQLLIIVLLKKKYGIATTSLLTVLFGTFMATILGVTNYGEGGLATALSFFDIIYAIPAYIGYRYYLRNGKDALTSIALISSVFILFISFNTFILLIPLLLSIIAIMILGLNLRFNKSYFSYAGLLMILLSLLFLLTSSATNYALRASFYPLYQDSLAKEQWIQKNRSNECFQGDIAGNRTEQGGVYDPQRLRVLNTCVRVTGTIMGIIPNYGPATDGDFIIELKIDEEYAYMLSFGSYWWKPGLMHVEVVPRDQGILSNLNLEPGMRIAVIGAWVLDTDHGWGSEIHPAWKIEVLD